ncbi:MAG TPA: hypothetical protein VHB74_15685, partial [Devosia sp.]|nr:hypothetical protein [Devosia sp.]
SLSADELTVGLTQVPPSATPLKLNFTGPHGGVGTYADITIDAASGADIGNLRFVDALIGINSGHISVASAYVPGSLRISSPFQDLFFNNRSPFPLPGSDVQLYQPTYAFSVLLNDFHTTSNAYVVQYQIGAQVTDVLDGVPIDGASLVRDSVRVFRNGDASFEQAFAWIEQPGKPKSKPAVEGNVVVINGVPLPIETTVEGPAVNLGGFH